MMAQEQQGTSRRGSISGGLEYVEISRVQSKASLKDGVF